MDIILERKEEFVWIIFGEKEEVYMDIIWDRKKKFVGIIFGEKEEVYIDIIWDRKKSLYRYYLERKFVFYG